MARIPLRNQHGELVAEALVDDADVEAVSAWTWSLHPGGYATHAGRLLMHRVILGLEPGDPTQGDHINRDRLDNRRANLRRCTRAEQPQNMRAKGGSSQYRGVSFCKQTGRWCAQVSMNHRHVNLGRYDDEVEAARVAEAYRREHMPLAQPDPRLA